MMNRSRFKYVRFVGLAVVLALAMSVGVSAQKTLIFPGVKRVGGTLVVIHWGDPKSFNPDAQVDDAGHAIFQQIFNKLVTLDINYNVIPDLAYKWEVSEDGLTYTFYLYPNATWHDGEPVTAYDVKWTFETINKSKGIAFGLIKASNIKSIEVVDDHTVRFHLKEPFAPFIQFLAWYGTYVMPAHIYEKYEDWMDPSNPYLNKPVGSGPFKFVEWVKGDHVTIEANENYFKGRPGLDKIVYKIVPDPTAALQAFLAGEGDVLNQRPPLTEIPKINATEGVIVRMRPVPSRWYIGFNLANPILSDLNVRLAIAHAIDREEIVEKALGGYGYPAEGTYVPAIAWAYNPNAKLPPFNPDKAREILDNAGYVDRNGDGIREAPDGTKLSFRLLYFTGAEEEAICTIIKERLKDVGIEVKLESLEIAAWEEKVVKKRDYELALCDGFQGPDPDNLRMRFGPGQYINFAGYNNTEFGRLLEEASKLTDMEKRKELYWKAQEIFAKDLPYLPLADLVAFYIWREGFHGFPWEPEAQGKVGYGVYAMVWSEKGEPVPTPTTPSPTTPTTTTPTTPTTPTTSPAPGAVTVTQTVTSTETVTSTTTIITTATIAGGVPVEIAAVMVVVIIILGIILLVMARRR